MVLRWVSIAMSCAMRSAGVTRAANKVNLLNRIRINPSQISFEQFRRKHAGHYLASAGHEPILPLPNVAHQQRALLHVPGSSAAQRFITAQRQFGRRLFAKRFSQYEGVFKSHATAQAEI